MIADAPPPLRLILDGAALVANWQALDRLSGTARAGAAVKANAYGLGAREVVTRLAKAGCRDFFVAHWSEAAAIADLVPPGSLSVLHGVLPGEEEIARAGIARPVINTPAQARRWRESGGGPCDVMLDSGMHRLGLSPADWRAGAADGLEIVTLMSHLASADEQSAQNDAQLTLFRELAGESGHRLSLANSAGITLGADYHFDLTRPGIALYGGIPCGELADMIRPVVQPEARVIQCSSLQPGDRVGYNAIFTAPRAMRVAVLSLGYADGYLRGFSGRGAARVDDDILPVVGRVSMDLLIINIDAAMHLREGDWVAIDYDLPTASAASGLSQYELLTGLGRRYERVWR